MKKIFFVVCIFVLLSDVILSVDWPQLQRDSQKTGRTTDTVLPPYRLRWMWLGTSQVIRNHLSNSSWTGPDLAPHDIIANEVTLPSSVSFTFAGGMQPVIADGKVYVGDQDGKVYCIDASSGSTLWTSDNPGGAVASPAYANNVIVFGSISGKIRGYRTNDGFKLWEVSTDGAITSPPATDGNIFCVGSHDGKVYCIEPSGNIRWVSPDLGRPVAGGIAIDGDTVYTGAENMMFYALNLTDGNIKFSKKVSGQSFYELWPVVFSSYVFIEAAGIPEIGSEYIGEAGYGNPQGPMGDAPDFNTEQNYILTFLNGQTAGTGGGGWVHASTDWKHFTVLRKSDFVEPYVVPLMPFEGCGSPPEPPVIDNQNRVLTYYKTKFSTFARSSAFGTNFTVDIQYINLDTGRTVQIQNGARADNDWYTWESDNLYGRTVGGNMLYLRQDFRGMVSINLQTSSAKLVLVHYSAQDGGGFENADVIYAGNRDTGARVPSSSMIQWDGRVGPAISGNYLYLCEEFAVVCVEHHQ